MPPRPTTAAKTRYQDERYRCLANERHRRILVTLAEDKSPLTETELAARLSAAESAVDADDGELDSVLVELRHVHLPQLAEAALLDWDRDRLVVSRRSGSADANVAVDPDDLGASWDSISPALSHRYRRLVLSIVSQNRGTMTFERLVRSFQQREHDAAANEVRMALHHVHLPALDAAGFLEYEHEEGTIRFLDHPAIEDGWFTSEVDHPTRSGSVRVCVQL